WNLGYIPQERIVATAEALRHLQGVAASYGAERLTVVATEVARTARNTAELLSTIQAMTGIETLVLSGMDEATLTFAGVTHGRHLPTSVAVADLGGGSLEVIIAEMGHGTWRTSLPLGSAFMHDRFAPHDPMHADEMARLSDYLTEKLAEIPQLSQVEALVICGGTVNALMRLVQQQQGRAGGDRVLRRTDLAAALDVMLATPSGLVAETYRLRMERARLLPTGTVILLALLDRLRLSGMTISPAGIREGIVLAVARAGDDWLAGARAGIDQAPFVDATTPLHSLSVGHQKHGHAAPDDIPLALQATTDVAWVQIDALVTEMLHHREAVLAGDVDAVHDMRVTARRARTMLEFFVPCFAAAPLRKTLRGIKRMARALGDVRDADVALATLEPRLQASDPELMPGLRLLVKAQLQARRTARKHLRQALTGTAVRGLRADVADLRLPPERRITLGVAHPPSGAPEEGALLP
ncbi:MAG: CHAD domain-containing protein, partial [Ktedonobacterales bacterium]|nr:CHAD domain-containing protein [Ktedonobacterales bacterium]